MLIGTVEAIGTSTVFNPFTSKLDYVWNGLISGNTNMSGYNITEVDMIRGNADNIRIGDAGTDTHSLTADDDLFVSGKLEVDGVSYFDGIVNFFSTIGTALNLGGNDLQNVTNIDGYNEIINMEDNTTFSGDKDIHYGLLDVNNDFNAQAEIQQGDTSGLLLFNRTINGTHIIFDSPQGLPFVFKENVTAENVHLPAYLFTHTNNTIAIASAGTWYNITFDVHSDAENSRVTHTYNDNTNDTFTIVDTGIYRIDYGISFVDSAANPKDHVAVRLIKDGVEIEGSVFEKDTTKQNAVGTLNDDILASLTAGEEVKIQFTSNATTVSLYTEGTYGTHPTTAQISFLKVAN